MDIGNYIKYKNVIPDTHYFVYKNKKYPIKMDYFKYASKYFQRQQHEIDLDIQKEIPLIENNNNINIDIDEEIINDFIKYVQSKKIYLNKNNAVPLNYLSTKYEIEQLQEITNKFIEEHEQELIIEIIKEHQYDNEFDTHTYEHIISKHISKYIDNDNLIELNLPILYRIFNEYFENTKHSSNIEESEIIERKIYEFLFKIVDKHGRTGSILFEKVRFGRFRKEYLNRLINEYSEIFNFEYITHELIEQIKSNETEIKLTRQEHERTLSTKNEELSQLRKTNERIIKSKEQQENENKQLQEKINENEQQYLTELTTHKQEASAIINKYEETITKQINEIKQLKEKNEEIQKENATLQLQQEQQTKQHLAELNSQKQFYIKQLEEIKNQNSIIHCPNGIFNYLFEKNKTSPIENGLVKIKGESYKGFDDILLKIIDPSFKGYWIPKVKENAFFEIKFKAFSVKINKYHIYLGDGSGRFIFKSWDLKGVTDNREEITLDSVNNCPEITSDHPEATINIKNDHYLRSIKFIIKGQKNCGQYMYDIKNIEIYGSIKYNT